MEQMQQKYRDKPEYVILIILCQFKSSEPTYEHKFLPSLLIALIESSMSVIEVHLLIRARVFVCIYEMYTYLPLYNCQLINYYIKSNGIRLCLP